MLCQLPRQGLPGKGLQATSHLSSLSLLFIVSFIPVVPLPFCLFTFLFIFLTWCSVTLMSPQLFHGKGPILEEWSKPW